jgi:hypothetical protein
MSHNVTGENKEQLRVKERKGGNGTLAWEWKLSPSRGNPYHNECQVWERLEEMVLTHICAHGWEGSVKKLKNAANDSAAYKGKRSHRIGCVGGSGLCPSLVSKLSVGILGWWTAEDSDETLD